MTKRIFFIFILSFTSQLMSQTTEVNFALGTCHFLGDLGGKSSIGTNDFSDLDFSTTRYMLGFGVKRYFNEKIGIRGNLNYARVSGDDKYSQNEPRKLRNLNFFSPIIQGSLAIEIHPFHLGNGSLYLYGGIGYFYFNPKTKYKGNKIELQPLGTEGQKYRNVPLYSKTSLSIPYGIGYRFNTIGNSTLGLELSMHKIFTDYIDDVGKSKFADPTLIAASSSGQLAADLSNRTLPNTKGVGNVGSKRGEGSNDNFFFISVNYHIAIAGKTGSRGRSKYRSMNRCYKF